MITVKVKRKQLERDVERIIRSDPELTQIQTLGNCAGIPRFVQQMMMIRYLADRKTADDLCGLRNQKEQSDDTQR